MTAPQSAPAFRHPDARCHGVDPELFFPHRDATGQADVRTAKRVCFGCPARQACLEHAVVWREPGIWGGTSERERRRIRTQWITAGLLRVENTGNRKQRTTLVEYNGVLVENGCGTNAGYVAHTRRNEEACASCREAHSAYVGEWKRKRRETAV